MPKGFGCKLLYLEDFYKRPKYISEKIIEKSTHSTDHFWISTIERFIVLDQYMKAYGIKKIFHAELDNVIFNIALLAEKLDFHGKGFFCPRDSLVRGIGSLVYINDVNTLSKIDLAYRSSQNTQSNDMEILGKLLRFEKNFFSLPSIPPTNLLELPNWDTLDAEFCNGIFDAAAFGQYLLGIDPKLKRTPLYNGFINENFNLNPSDIKFDFNKDNYSLKVSYKLGESYKLYNLHIHSKLMRIIINRNKFFKIILRINKGKKTLIKLNLINIFRLPKRFLALFK
jgi:hypothetical protein